MPKRPVELHPEAIAEARSAREWYEHRNVAAATAFLAEIDYAIEQIAEVPDRWPQYIHGTRRYLLRRFPFSIVYHDRGEVIQVLAVAHGRRRPGYWEDRA